MYLLFIYFIIFFVTLFYYRVSYLYQQMYLGENRWIIRDSICSAFLQGGYQSGAISKQHAEVPWTFRHVVYGTDASCFTHLYFERVDLSGSSLWKWVFYRMPVLPSALAFDLSLSFCTELAKQKFKFSSWSRQSYSLRVEVDALLVCFSIFSLTRCPGKSLWFVQCL